MISLRTVKRIVLVVSGAAGVLLIVLNQIGTFRLCGGSEYGECMVQLHDALIVFLPILPLFLLSLITYRMRDAVVRPWLYFTAGWIPLSMVLIYITPASRHGDWLNPFVKGSVAFYLSVLYVIISAILITIVWSETNLTDKQKHM